MTACESCDVVTYRIAPSGTDDVLLEDRERVLQSQGLEQLLLQDHVPRLAEDGLDQTPEDDEAPVAVRKRCAWFMDEPDRRYTFDVAVDRIISLTEVPEDVA